MTFDDPFLLNDGDALTETCTVEVAGAVTTEDEWGLGGSVETPASTLELSCMEIPEYLRIDRSDGVAVPISVGLVIADTGDQVKYHSRIQYRSKRYQVEFISGPVQHNMKRAYLGEV